MWRVGTDSGRAASTSPMLLLLCSMSGGSSCAKKSGNGNHTCSDHSELERQTVLHAQETPNTIDQLHFERSQAEMMSEEELFAMPSKYQVVGPRDVDGVMGG